MKYRPEELIAHSENAEGRVQPLVEHLENVAEMAAQFAAPFGSEDFARWIGWWHDAGKVADDIQDYLRGKGTSQDHSSIGMLKAALEKQQALAFIIAGHHGGLADRDKLNERIKRKREEDRIRTVYEQAEKVLGAVVASLPDELPALLRDSADRSEFMRRVAFWTRMLHSCLIDADCLDTEEHFDPERARSRAVPADLDVLWQRFQEDQEKLVADAVDTPVNLQRQRVYEACLIAADAPPGIFSLTVPTGGGKTRSVMAFSLCHSIKHEKRRVIVALPYTSIIDQNADVYRDIFGEGIVLEHHSAIENENEPGEETDEERWRRLAAQNWDVPIVVTTTVQLLESLFSNQNSRIRKLHNLAESVIVLDEVQTLPPRLLTATLEGLRYLVEDYGATVVLCTATQPALKARRDFPDGLSNVREIIPEPEGLYETLSRVTYYVDLQKKWSWGDVASRMLTADQAMLVCNTIRDAIAAFDAFPDSIHVFHLSTQLCGAHRRKVLDTVKERLTAGLPVYLVATQVVEAGVDISFPLVLRALGPLDRIIQAAGRCNRNGELERGEVIVFEPEHGGAPPGAYRTGRDITRQFFRRDEDLNLHDPTLPPRYFTRLYRSRDSDMGGVQPLREAFKFESVARAYRLIEDDTTAVVVDYGRGWDLLDSIADRSMHRGFVHRNDWRRIQPFTVKLCNSVLEEAGKRGECYELAPDLWRWDGGYDSDRRGLHWEGPSASELVF